MARKSKILALRKGLTVDELLVGTWMITETRYTTDHEMVEMADGILRAAVQGLIEAANDDKQVTRQTIINTFCSISKMLIMSKDWITQKMGEGKFTPTLLDEIANA